MTATLAGAEPLSGALDTGRSEQQVRATLKPHGYRLSQRNGGFVVIDSDDRYVVTGFERGPGPEISLGDILIWFGGRNGPSRSR